MLAQVLASVTAGMAARLADSASILGERAQLLLLLVPRVEQRVAGRRLLLLLGS